MHEDVIVIEAIKRGDRERYGELVDRYDRLVYGIAWSRLGDRALCEDVVQETFVQGFRFLGTLRKPERFAAWISRIARNIAGRIARRNRRHLANLRRWQLDQEQAEDVSAEDASSDRPTQEMLSDALGKLSATHRECLVLFYLKNQSVREAATSIGISESAFKTRLHRARVSLRTRLERQLESQLAEIQPSAHMRSRVLSVLPVSPIGLAGSGFSFSGLASGAKSLCSSMVWGWPFFFFLYLGLIVHLLACNFQQGKAFRRKVLWHNFILLILVLIPILLLSAWAAATHGQRVLYVILALYMMVGVVGALLLLRVSRTRLAVAVLTGNVALALALACMGIWNVSIVWFFAAMLIVNIGLWLARQSMPYRMDYNLFLRAVQSGLGYHQPNSIPVESVSSDDRKAFTRFLSKHYLVNDWSYGPSQSTCYLPPVAGTLMTTFLFPLPRFNGSSTITIHSDGTCRASISRRDRRLLPTFSTRDPMSMDELEQHVAEAVQTSLGLFLRGDQATALAALQAYDDEAVFARPPHKLLIMRFMYSAAILSGLVALGTYSYSLWPLWPARGSIVTAEDARDTVSGWLNTEYRPGDEAYFKLYTCLNSQRLPPADFWSADDREALTHTGLTMLQEKIPGGSHWARNSIEVKGQFIYNLLNGGYATVSDLQSVGLDRDAVLKHQDQTILWDSSGHPNLTFVIKENRIGERQPDKHLSLFYHAYGIWCLKELDCLDAFDTSVAAPFLASHQLTPDHTTTESEDISAQAAGLFQVSDPEHIYEDTWAVLFSLQTLGRLDMIDRQACIEGLMRHYRGRGNFADGVNAAKPGDRRSMQTDAYYALESLVILDAVDRIPDLDQWSFEARRSRTRYGERVSPYVAPEAIEAWARQKRLQDIRRSTGIAVGR